MFSVRYRVWVSRTGRKGASILPKLKSLPSTVAAFRENVKRAHFKLAFGKLHCNRIHQSWIHLSLDGHPKDHQVYIAQCHYQVKLKLPLQMLINCSCCSDSPCTWQICSCSSAQLACSLFCKCEGSSTCYNPKTVFLVQETEHD